MIQVLNASKEYCIPSFRGYEEDIVARDATISFGELSPVVVRAPNNSTIFEHPPAYAIGCRPQLSFEFTSMSSRAKRSFITSKCLYWVAYKSGEWLYSSFEFTSMSCCAKRSFVTSKCPYWAAYESGNDCTSPSGLFWCCLVPQEASSFLNARLGWHMRAGNYWAYPLGLLQCRVVPKEALSLLNARIGRHMRAGNYCLCS